MRTCSSSPRPIALVGMPGVGKSSVGRLLADRLGLRFMDSDEAVVAEAGRSIAAMFFSEGQTAFRQRERAVIERLLNSSDLIIATGGGAMVEAETRRLLLDRATTVWLDASAETLVDRLRDQPPRPLVVGEGLLAKLEAMEAERRLFYAQAGFAVQTDGLSPQQTADRIAEALSRSECR